MVGWRFLCKEWSCKSSSEVSGYGTLLPDYLAVALIGSPHCVRLGSPSSRASAGPLDVGHSPSFVIGIPNNYLFGAECSCSNVQYVYRMGYGCDQTIRASSLTLR